MYPLPEDHWINQPIESENCLSLMQLSVGQPNTKFTQLLIRAGARADQYNDMLDMAPIHSAILGGHGEQHLVALLEDDRNRASVNTSMQPSGETSLHLAAQRGMQTCLKILLEQPDADVDAKEMTTGKTPLYLAALNKHEECVRMLIENGANLDTQCGNNTPLSLYGNQL